MSSTPGAGLTGSLDLVERWAEDEDTRVGSASVRNRHKALMTLARRLGDRSLAEATVGDTEEWLASVGAKRRVRRRAGDAHRGPARPEPPRPRPAPVTPPDWYPTRFLTAGQLDELADPAEAFQLLLLAAYEESGHGWRAATVETADGLPILGDRTCLLCGEPMPCPAFAGVMAAAVAIRDALVGLGVWREVLTDADARHGPLTAQ